MKKNSAFAILLICTLLTTIISCENKQTNKIEFDQYILENTLNTSILGKQEDIDNKLNEILYKEEDKKENANEKQEENKPQEKSVKKTIVIDPGHGGKANLEKEKQSPDSNVMKIKDGGGAQGNITRVREAEIVLKISFALKNLLEKDGYNVIMTRTDDSRSMGNIERAEIANNNNADLCIRVHCDSAESTSANGASMLVPDKVGYAKQISDKSKEYGEIILNSLVNKAKMNNRGIIISNNMTGFNWSKVPVVLVELGFLSNQSEEKKLCDENYQNLLAEGLHDGIIKAIN